MFSIFANKNIETMAYCYLKKCFTGFIILTFFLVKSSFANMQDTTAKSVNHVPGMVTGIVIDEENRPVKGAEVSVKGTATVFTTDITGRFEIKAGLGSVLIFKYPGHNVSEITVKTDKELTVKILDTYLQSPEKIDVLYGQTDKSSSLGSVATIYTNQLT